MLRGIPFVIPTLSPREEEESVTSRPSLFASASLDRVPHPTFVGLSKVFQLETRNLKLLLIPQRIQDVLSRRVPRRRDSPDQSHERREPDRRRDN